MRWKPWLPVGASLVLLIACLVLAVRTPPVSVRLPPLPSAVHVDPPLVPELHAEPGHPLFAPSRSNAPIGVDPAAGPPAALPALTGIALGGGRAVATIKNQKGETTILHVGEAADGWTVRAIVDHAVTFERDGEQHVVPLVFGPAATGANAPPPSGSAESR